MIIRKKFKFEGAHIVRDCSSNRCKKSLHGHSYIVEVFLTSNKLDYGQMIYDFGLTKGTIKDIIDSFDHAYAMWSKESDDFKSFIKANSDRYIIMPVSPSAECFSLTLLFLIDKILQATEFKNGEGDVRVRSVRVHETETGYAEAFREDLEWFNFSLKDIIFSSEIKNEWTDKEMYDKLIAYYDKQLGTKPFSNPVVSRHFE
ncbi:6-pyruvoyl trahydropterin synthase family protein [Saccharicrinis fermentans]|uniref:6-carboxy-5,6,7,8-tetrahydropterin synthase n=1 Tax=Saccharicrinis fermentans DSM 9555 = JCM 21142 TaxID=869213 RepID=W7YKG1_9BACT|nr:6-carboxytetrahydropterin synthase [Saccharicrinis fermentans]GAF02844.1 queuosine biosynthesis protein QueD [Saccharicrinis fermentans DSM 9555 = JCM 21142]